jgi:lipopolysaccharide export system permease protein
MKILKKLYIKEFLTLLSIVGIGLSLILSLINLIEKLDDFMQFSPSFEDIALYVGLNMPKNLFYLLPMAVLICGLFVFARATKSMEIVAIKAGCGRIRSILITFMFIGLILSTFAFFLDELVMPRAMEMAGKLKIEMTSAKQRDISKRGSYQKPFFKEGTIWVKGKDDSIIRIGLLYENKVAQDITIFLFEKGSLSGHIKAEKALWNGKIWTLVNVTRYFFEDGKIENMKEMPYPNLEAPKYFKAGLKTTEEMGIGELLRYIKRLKQSGYRNPKLIVDLNSRLSYPLINFFMLILGVSLPLASHISRGLIAAGIGLSISLLYWTGYILSISIGNAGIIPPFLAPWLMPVIFAAIAIELFRKLPE